MRQATAWALVVAFATPLWVYAGSSFDIAEQALFLVAGVWLAVEAFALHSMRLGILSGVAFALLINVQETYLVLVGCVAGIPTSVRAAVDRLRRPELIAIARPIVIGLGVVFLYNTYKFGNPLSTGRETVPHPLVGNPLVGLAGLFVSPAKSILLYSPTYPFALYGIYRLVRRDRGRYGAIAACLLIHVALVASLKFWAGEWAWGPRYLIATLPLACIGLPFAVRSARGRAALATACVLGVVVQLMAISVDHQRYYIDRSFEPFFWVDEMSMYRDSPLLARPGEMVAVYEQRDFETVRALVPGPTPMSMTGPIYGPPFKKIPNFRVWMRQYLVFLAPRPWPLWSRLLSPDLRPGRTDIMIRAGLVAAIAGFAMLWLILRDPRSRESMWSGGVFEHEQVIES
jgi:hypothetical protein